MNQFRKNTTVLDDIPEEKGLTYDRADARFIGEALAILDDA
jgi:hypothetical protein